MRRSWLVTCALAALPLAAMGERAPGPQEAGAIGPRVRALCAAALERTRHEVRYDPAYVRLDYPNGDLPRERGVCTDVIVRSYRDGLGVDLQRLVHEDMRDDFDAYPRHWGLRAPDRNIDHRRVPNLRTFWRRRGAELPVSRQAADYRPGDLVTWDLGGRPHVGLVVDRRAAGTDRPLVVHNVGAGTRLEDCLFSRPVTGHYRWLPAVE